MALFFSLSLVAFVVTNFFVPKEYTSTSTISNNAAIAQATYTLMQNGVKSDATMEAVTKNLAESKVTHADGKAVTKAEISSGLSFSAFASNMVSFTMTFKSKEQALTQYVLAEVADVALDVLKPTYPNLNLTTPATAATKTSKESTYLLIGVAAALVVGLGAPFIYEIVVDQVYEASDINDMGAEGFELRASGK